MEQGGQRYGGQQSGQQYGGQQGSQQFSGQQGATQSQFGGGQQMGGGQQHAQTLDDYLTGDERLLLHDVVTATHTSAWCADLCIDEGPQMATCIRLCEDIEELGSVTQEFIARDSVFTPHVVETLVEAARECAMECERHQAPHCQENASVLHKLVQSGTEYLRETSGGQSGSGGQQQRTGGAQSEMGGRSGGGQPGGTDIPIDESQY